MCITCIKEQRPLYNGEPSHRKGDDLLVYVLCPLQSLGLGDPRDQVLRPWKFTLTPPSLICPQVQEATWSPASSSLFCCS